MSAPLVIERQDLGIDYRDVSPWRNYELSTDGNSVEECLSNAVIAEVDQEGDDLRCYSLKDASAEIRKAVEQMIQNRFEKGRKAPLERTYTQQIKWPNA